VGCCCRVGIGVGFFVSPLVGTLREMVFGEVEADERFGGDLNLLAAGDGVGSGSGTAAGSGLRWLRLCHRPMMAAEDGADGCSATDLRGGVGAAALALDAIGFGVDGDLFAVTIDAGEFHGEQGTAFVVGRPLERQRRGR